MTDAHIVNSASDQTIDGQRGGDVHVQRVASGVDSVAANDDADLYHAGAVEGFDGLDTVVEGF